MIYIWGAPIKLNAQTGRACPMRKAGASLYGANYNFINDDGGWLATGGTNSGIQRTAAVCARRGIPTPRTRRPEGDHSTKNGETVISSTRLASSASLPVTRPETTLDTQNGCTRASNPHPARPANHPAYTTAVTA